VGVSVVSMRVLGEYNICILSSAGVHIRRITISFKSNLDSSLPVLRYGRLCKISFCSGRIGTPYESCDELSSSSNFGQFTNILREKEQFRCSRRGDGSNLLCLQLPDLDKVRAPIHIGTCQCPRHRSCHGQPAILSPSLRAISSARRYCVARASCGTIIELSSQLYLSLRIQMSHSAPRWPPAARTCSCKWNSSRWTLSAWRPI
jgi:hypothetical protein